MLKNSMKMKVFALVDCDPYGIEIAAILKWGGVAQSGFQLNAMIVPDLIWLGLRPSEIMELSLPQTAVAKMNDRDSKKLFCLQTRLSYYDQVLQK